MSEQITFEQALNNLIFAANQGKFTLQEADIINQSIQKLKNLVLSTQANKEAVKPSN